MAKPSKAKAPEAKAVEPAGKNPSQLSIVREEGKTRAEQLADASLSPIIRNAALSQGWGDDFFGKKDDPSDLDRCVTLVAERCAEVRAGNLDSVTDMLTAQMAAMDALFTSMVTRAGKNIGGYPEAVDRYMGIAMKAQAGCRTTAETLARIKRGGKQTVKVIHVHEGGQAVVADTVNTGGSRGVIAENDRQPHDQSAQLAALPRPNPEGDELSVSSFERQEAVPIARRA